MRSKIARPSLSILKLMLQQTIIASEKALDLQKTFSCKNLFKYLFSLPVIEHDSSICSVNSDILYMYNSSFQQIKLFEANRKKHAKVTKQTIHIQFQSTTYDSRLFAIEGSRFAIRSFVMDVTIRMPGILAHVPSGCS